MRKKQFLFLYMALCMAMTVCLYCATLADFSFWIKICFGIVAALLYVLTILVPYSIRKRKNRELSLQAYLREFIDETVAKD